MKVLVTGGSGYIGARLVPQFLGQGYQVRALDLFSSAPPSPPPANYEFLQGDMRDKSVLAQGINGAQAVVHLAAYVMVSDKASAAEEQMMDELNYQATQNLVDLCRASQVQRFIFTSTCSNYGVTAGQMATEDAPLQPSSAYARSKVKAEAYVLAATSASFHPTVLRLATVFGYSPRMGFNSLLHQFIHDAVVKKSLSVRGPQSWRPFVHVDDVVRAIRLVLKAAPELVSGQVFNVGSNELNVQKIHLVELIKKHLPQTQIEVAPGNPDPRDYRVSFDKIAQQLGFRTTRSLEEGIVEVIEALEQGQLASPGESAPGPAKAS